MSFILHPVAGILCENSYSSSIPLSALSHSSLDPSSSLSCHWHRLRSSGSLWPRHFRQTTVGTQLPLPLTLDSLYILIIIMPKVRMLWFTDPQHLCLSYMYMTHSYEYATLLYSSLVYGNHRASTPNTHYSNPKVVVLRQKSMNPYAWFDPLRLWYVATGWIHALTGRFS